MKHMLQSILVLTLILLTACHSARTAPHMENLHAAHTRSFDGSDIVFDAEGTGEPALVFIHGWCCNRGQWENQTAAFAKDHRVVAIDLAGHGESSDNRTDWTLENFSRDVEAVVHHLDLDQVILVGHSMGGPVALMAAKRMPDRVVGVIGVDTLHNAEFEMPGEMVEQFATSFEQDFEGTMAGFLGMMYPPQIMADPGVLQRIRSDALKNDPEMAADLMRQFGDLDSRALMKSCHVPVLCINAGSGNPTMIEVNRRYNPRFDATIMQGVGHWPHLEKPAEFNQKLREQIASVMRDAAT